jgi:hypothetical protein
MEKSLRVMALSFIDKIRNRLTESTSQGHPGESPPSFEPASINETKFVFDQNGYSTSLKDIPGWLDWLFDRSPLSTAVTAVVVSFVVFIGGFVIAKSISFDQEYLTSIPIYVGSIGIALVLGIIRYVSKKIHISYEKLRPCFLVDDTLYKNTVTSWLSKIWSPGGNWPAFIILFLISIAAVHVTFYKPSLLNNSLLSSLKPPLFRESWFTGPGIDIKAAIIIYYGFFISYLLGPSLRMLILNFFFLRDLKKFPVIPIANIIRSRFQGVKAFYVHVSFAWFIGVGLFGFVFFNKLDVLSVFFLISLSIIGLLTFLTPHIIFRGYLESSHELACNIALASLNRDIGINLKENHVTANHVGLDISLNKLAENLKDLSGIILSTSLPKPFIYDTSDTLMLVMGQLIAFARLLFEIYKRTDHNNIPIPAITYCLPF